MLEAYTRHVAERAALGLPPNPLTETQTRMVTDQLANAAADTAEMLLNLLTHRVPPGVDPAAKIKAAFLADVANGRLRNTAIDAGQAVDLLGTMRGGFNVRPLIDLLDDPELAPRAADALSRTLLVFDAFEQILDKAKKNKHAERILTAWADAEWFLSRPEVPETLIVTAFKIEGEITTDDLSPADEAWSRPDIPLHAAAMLKNRIADPLGAINQLKAKGRPLAFVGDVVGTGSSRKSAGNSVLWHIGEDIPHVPNKRAGGIVLGGKIAPIFFNTMEDAGALPIECDVSGIRNGDVLRIQPYAGEIRNHEDGRQRCRFTVKTSALFDAVRAGGRIPLIIGRDLTAKACRELNRTPPDVFHPPVAPAPSTKGFSLAQKIVGRACGEPGIRPGTYCEPAVTSVGSQDTTGPMTRDELTELACLKFSAPLVMQSFCHTAAYPKPVDIEMHWTLPRFFQERGGIALNPGDGVVHSWLNRMILPDTVGTGGDSHTRFPVGISFPAGSGLVAFSAAMGILPLDMPGSVLVRFNGARKPHITIRDLVNAIPLAAIQNGLLTVAKENKKNIFSGRILEIEGLPDLPVEAAFELTDASAERSAAAGVIQLNPEPVITYIEHNIMLLKDLLARGYQDADAIRRRITAMETWLASPELLNADPDADYAAVIDIDLDTISEPVVACPNDPDDVRYLSDVAGATVDEVFIGSCMTHADHFRNVARLLDGEHTLSARLWLAPPTRMDAAQLKSEGLYAIFGRSGARIEIPGCSLCMGNQARVAPGSTVMSTSTRNFPNRMGDQANVYLGSAELATICALTGKMPTLEEYRSYMNKVGNKK